MKLYTILIALFSIGLVSAGENMAATVDKSELSRRILKRYLENNNNKIEKRSPGNIYIYIHALIKNCISKYLYVFYH
jgi:hypothetical protein